MRNIIIILLFTTFAYAEMNIDEISRQCIREFENENRYSLSLDVQDKIKNNIKRIVEARKQREWGKFNNAKEKVFGYCPDIIDGL